MLDIALCFYISEISASVGFSVILHVNTTLMTVSRQQRIELLRRERVIARSQMSESDSNMRRPRVTTYRHQSEIIPNHEGC